MKFYTYHNGSVNYKRFNFITLKNIIVYFFIQIIITLILFFIISTFYETPREKKLKGDTAYLLYEFKEINQRIIQSEATLSQIKENDSIIYKAILDAPSILDDTLKTYYDEDLNNNNYSNIVKESNEKLITLDKKLYKELPYMNSLMQTVYSHQEMLLHLPAIQPIENKNLKRTASGWGMRLHPILGVMKFHYGLDFSSPEGSPIYATADGTIQYAIKSTDKASQGYGNLIIINHGYGYQTVYGHMLSFNVKGGQKVKRGEIIGYVGNTGLSTGPHVHYEIIKNGVKVNPIYYLFNDLTPEEYQKIIDLSNSVKKSYD